MHRDIQAACLGATRKVRRGSGSNKLHRGSASAAPWSIVVAVVHKSRVCAVLGSLLNWERSKARTQRSTVQVAHGQAALSVLKQLKELGALNVYTGGPSAQVDLPALLVPNPGASFMAF